MRQDASTRLAMIMILTLRCAADMARMADVEALADIVIDSSGLSPADLRGALLGTLGLDKAPPMPVHIVSFSYRHGLPETADQVFDMRFAKNPHWDDGLRDQTGLDSKVAEFLAKDEMAIAVLDQVKSMLALMLSRMEQRWSGAFNTGLWLYGWQASFGMGRSADR
jgi:UPF0042 nucleotide-binding protein